MESIEVIQLIVDDWKGNTIDETSAMVAISCELKDGSGQFVIDEIKKLYNKQ